MSLHLHRASAAFQGVPALVDCSITVEAGQVHALLGPNGAGKTTALRLLAGDHRPSRGTATLDDRPLAQWTAAALATRRAVLMQRTALDFAFRTREVVQLGRAFLGPPDHAVVDAVLSAFALEALAERPFTQLSGGQQQRVQLARVAAQVWPDDTPTARYLLLDEPTANLDLAVQQQVLAAIRQLAARGLGVLWVVHDVNLAARHADTVTLLRAGQTVAQGPADTALTTDTLSQTFGVPMQALAIDGQPALWQAIDPDQPLRQT